ncbi:GAF and ANTAR domain-containing protein [Streptomyces anandii]|uniref:GAF and ANTAR domain-containing protein n=1 Tax=Streptomyces anandii TaxID=285454 RepID=UPI0036F682DF
MEEEARWTVVPPGDLEQPSSGGGPSEKQTRLQLIEALASAAGGADPGAVPTELCRACTRLLAVSGASVSISAGPGVRPTWCASDRTSARLAEAQYTLGAGPCQSALDQGAPVLATDLTGGPDARRWPLFAHQAVELGVRAVFSLPLGVGGPPIGTLDLYREVAGALADQDLRTALWVRDAITFTLLNLHAAADFQRAEEGVASWVEAAEADHTEVYQAVGMVMVQLRVDSEEALDRMRARAFAEGRSVSQVARDVTARRLRFRPEPDNRHGGNDGRRGGDDTGWDGER